MGKELLFVLNPLSGKGKIKNKFLSIVDVFVKNGWNVTVHTTQGAEDAFCFIKDNGSRYDLVVVSGGDGTLNEGIRGLMSLEENERPCLGYIPAGTTNDFASNMKISKNMVKAAENIMGGTPFKCDIGCFNDNNFIYVAAFGAFTDVAYATPQQNKNMMGHAAYLLEGAKKLSNLKSHKMKVCFDGGEIEGEFVYGMVSNTNYLGGFKTEKAFKAELNDGLFEVVLIKTPKNVMEFQDLMSHIVMQDFKTDAIFAFRTKKVEFVSEEQVQWTLDGEFGGAVSNADIGVKKEAVTLMIKQ